MPYPSLDEIQRWAYAQRDNQAPNDIQQTTALIDHFNERILAPIVARKAKAAKRRYELGSKLIEKQPWNFTTDQINAYASGNGDYSLPPGINFTQEGKSTPAWGLDDKGNPVSYPGHSKEGFINPKPDAGPAIIWDGKQWRKAPPGVSKNQVLDFTPKPESTAETPQDKLDRQIEQDYFAQSGKGAVSPELESAYFALKKRQGYGIAGTEGTPEVDSGHWWKPNTPATPSSLHVDYGAHVPPPESPAPAPALAAAPKKEKAKPIKLAKAETQTRRQNPNTKKWWIFKDGQWQPE